MRIDGRRPASRRSRDKDPVDRAGVDIEAVGSAERVMKAGEEEAVDVRIASAISKLDEMANDPNIPLHGRTLIWNIISQLEQVKQ